MKLTNREKIILPALLIIILSALFINFAYFPLDKEIKEMKTKSQELDGKVTELETKKVELEGMKKQIKELSSKIKEDNKNMMKIWDQTVLLVTIEKLMTNLSEQKSISIFDVVDVTSLQAGDVTVGFKTNYVGLKNVIRNLENAEYFNTIPDYSIKMIETGTENTATSKYDLEVNLKLKFYSIPMQKGFPKKYDFMSGAFGRNNIFKDTK